MPDLETNRIKTLNWIYSKVQSGELDNKTLVQIIELCGRFLNLETIPDYCKRTGLSYNGVKNHREIVELFNCKFVIDND